MAIKWKNSKKGILLVLMWAVIAATIMCSAYPLFRRRANKLLAEYEAEHVKEQEGEEIYAPDEMFKRFLLSSIYYMNYEMTPDMDAYTYFTQNYDMSKFTKDEQRRVQEAATRLMQNMRNQYSVMQSNYDYGSYGSGPAREFGGDGYLSSAVHGNSEDARQYYQSGLVIQYDSRGVPVIRESWGFDLEETDIIGYLQQASMARLMDDNGMGDVVYDTDVYYSYDSEQVVIGETVPKSEIEILEETAEETWQDPYEEASRNDQDRKSVV